MKETENQIHHEAKQRSSRSEVFCEKDVLRNFAKLTGKHLLFSCEFQEISKNTFLLRTPLVAASVNNPEI